MSDLHDALPALDAALPDGADAPPRHDLYAHIHKAMRHFLVDTLLRVGALEVRDEAEVGSVLGQLAALLDHCEQHIAHEHTFVHPALEACRDGASRRIAGEHEEHHEAIASLREDARQLLAAAPARRDALAQRLYRHLALFTADNFLHMHHEETVHNATLWAHFSDAELEKLHARLRASLPPGDLFTVARWMIPAMTPRERAGMLLDGRAHAPAGAFDALVAHVRPHLDATAWARLAPEIGRTAGPVDAAA